MTDKMLCFPALVDAIQGQHQGMPRMRALTIAAQRWPAIHQFFLKSIRTDGPKPTDAERASQSAAVSAALAELRGGAEPSPSEPKHEDEAQARHDLPPLEPSADRAPMGAPDQSGFWQDQAASQGQFSEFWKSLP